MTDQRPIGYWLATVDRLIDETFATTLDEHGVTRRQWQLLEVLERGPGTAEQLDRAVAPFLGRGGTASVAAPVAADAPAGDDLDGDGTADGSVEHLAELIESGWVETRATESGLLQYAITERGATAHERLAVVVRAGREAATEGVSPEEYNQLLAVLERIARNLGWTE